MAMLPTTLHFYTLQVKTLIDLFSSSFVSSTTSIVFQNTSASIESFLRSGGHPLFSYQLIFSYQFFFSWTTSGRRSFISRGVHVIFDGEYRDFTPEQSTSPISRFSNDGSCSSSTRGWRDKWREKLNMVGVWSPQCSLLHSDIIFESSRAPIR